ncbi:MAG: permease [Spirochaetota bacterium]
MKEKETEKREKTGKKEWLYFGAALVVMIALGIAFPSKRGAVAEKAWNFLIEMITILPAIMILMGIFTVWVPREKVVLYLGEKSGLKGVLLSILFGSLPTGPLYVAFPLAQSLLKKGASITNIVIFLSAWACIKIPQELVELQFLGIKFMVLRLTLTIIFVSLMGFIIEKIIENKKGRNSA